MFINLHKCPLWGCLLIALVLGACAPRGVEQPQPEPVALKVVAQPYLSFAPFFIAEEEGYFAEQGLQIEFLRMDRADKAVPALAQGEFDVAGGRIAPSHLNAMARGAHIKVVACKGYLSSEDCTYAAIMVRRVLIEDGELESPTQLRGRRIAAAPGTFSSYYLDALLNTAGLTLDDIETLDIPTATRGEALAKGSVDGVTAAEPWVTRISQAGQGVIWMPAQQVLPDFQWAFVIFGPTLLEENPDAGRRFMVAYLKAVQQYNQGKTERNLEILAEHTGLDRELLTQACWPPFRDDGRINVQSVLDFQAWALENGYLDSLVTEEQFWDPSFVEYANQVLGASSQ
jgi:NitT/TauT family transport system substrate-binding protein